MKIAIEDLELALQWVRENSNDAYAKLVLETAKAILIVGTPNQEVVRVTIFDADSALQAKITKEDYLKHNVKKRS